MAINQIEGLDRLFDAVLTLKDRQECYMFFEDLCTIGELTAMAQRLGIAGLLHEGAKGNEIAAATGASSATVSRVNRCLQYGSGGYELVLDREEKK